MYDVLKGCIKRDGRHNKKHKYEEIIVENDENNMHATALYAHSSLFFIPYSSINNNNNWKWEQLNVRVKKI